MSTRGLCLLVALGLLACGEAGAAVDGGGDVPPSTCEQSSALQTVTSMSGAYGVSACTLQTPARGENAFTFLITDSAGAPVSDLTLAIQTWMPDMGHGGPTTPTVTAIGSGLYQITNCVLTMGGVWQLRTTLSSAQQETASDSAIIQFEID